ncbi:MAG: CHAT domain-containing protein [Thermoanaerobaculia bacterium]
MAKKLAVTWLLGSVMPLWIGLATAEPLKVKPAPPTTAASSPAEGQEGKALKEDRSELRGVVIEEISKGSALEKAGFQVGDAILSWVRLPNPPANPEAAQGELASYFDWLELKVEQAPRGKVVLSCRRGGAHLEITVEPGVWDTKMRPALSQGLEEIYQSGKAQFAAGDLEAAVRAWRSLTDSTRGEGRGDLRAWILLRLGEAWGERGEWGKAVEACREALGASDPSIQVAVWEALGEAHEMRSEYEKAEKAYAAALEIRQRICPTSLGKASSLNHLGDVAWARGESDRALDYFERGLRIREQLAPQSLDMAESLFNLGMTARARGDLEHAYDYYHQGLNIQMQLSPLSLVVANSLNSLGLLAHNRGDLDLADDYHHRSLQMKEKLAPNSLTVAYSLNNLGALALDRGELDRAHDYHLQAMRIRERLAPQSLDVANSLNNLGTVAHARGELIRAFDFYFQALQIRKRLAPQSLMVAYSLSNLGALARDRKDLEGALSYNLQALRIFEQLAPESLSVASCLNNLGALAEDRGELDRAYNYHFHSLQIRNRLAPQSLAASTSLLNLGDVSLVRKDFDRAQNYLLQALRIKEHLAPRSYEEAIILSYLGDIARARGFLDSARNFYSRALDTLEHQVSRLGGSYSVQAGFRVQHGAYYQSLRDLLLAQSRFDEAFHGLERFRAQTFLTMLAERDTAFTADIPQELDHERRRIGAQYDRTLKKLAGLNPRDDSEAIEATRKELQKLDDESGDIEARIRQASPRLAALRYPQPLDAAAAQQALDSGTLLLSFSVGKDRTALYTLSRERSLEVKTLPLGDEAFRSRVKLLLSLTREAKGGSSLGEHRRTQLQAVSRDIYTELLGPVADRIAASERLLILPDGPLHVLPFGALVRDSKDGPQYLAAWKPLHVALSATVYAELKQRRHSASDQNTPQAPLQLAAFGDPVYPQRLAALKKASTDPLPAEDAIGAGRGDPTVRGAAERGLFDFQPLPYTRREVLEIASLFPAGTARTYLGPEALEERIKSLDPKTRILHLAAHASVDEHLPSGSFIALTIPEGTPPDGTGPQRDNGLLQVWEIFEQVRLNADLVVLSACDTGLGEELGGEGLIGLTRAFQYAGARSVMASLWSVNDQATAELMIRFYKHLRAGLPKDQALQAAQRELIAGPIEITSDTGERVLRDFSSPYYWAGFQLYGDWQ